MRPEVCPECGGAVSDDIDVCPACGELLAEDVLVYEMEGWSPEEREALGALLTKEGVAHRFDGDELLVPEDTEEVVDDLMDRIDFPDALEEADEDDDTDDEAVYAVMSDLFVVADRLAGRVDINPALVLEFVSASEAATASPAPYGTEERMWTGVQESAAALASALLDDAPYHEVYDQATALRDLLRMYV